MRKSYIYALFAACLINFSACDREEVPVVEEPGELIRVEASGTDPQTRGLLNKADLKKAGTKVKVYDYLTGFTGKIDNQSYTNGSVIYIDDSVTLGTDGGSDWKFSSFDWRWTRTGAHHFYGWLEHDSQSGMDIPSGWATVSSDKKSLSVGPFALKADSPQFDFSYSDIVTVDVEGDGFDPNGTIVLPLKHLFSSLAMTIENQGEDAVNIVSLELTGLNNSKSASINYSGTSQTVTYSTAGTATQLVSGVAGKSLTTGDKLDLYTGGTASNPILMWPQTAAEVKTAVFNLSYSIAGVYKTEEGHESELEVFNRQLKLTDTGRFTDGGGNDLGLDAGKKYAINILFKGKTIDLKLIVMPWDYQTFDLDYSSSSIAAKTSALNEGVMWLSYWGLKPTTNDMGWISGDRDTRTVVMASGTDVRGVFYIESPHSGRWQLSMYPAEAAQYFTIEPSSGEITQELIAAGGAVNFTVHPKGVVPSQQIVHFNLAFRFNGESQWRDGNSEFNRKDWKIVREP